jgi:hypothetical protein
MGVGTTGKRPGVPSFGGTAQVAGCIWCIAYCWLAQPQPVQANRYQVFKRLRPYRTPRQRVQQQLWATK